MAGMETQAERDLREINERGQRDEESKAFARKTLLWTPCCLGIVFVVGTLLLLLLLKVLN